MVYAEIKNGVCVNVVSAEEEYAKAIGLVEVADGYWIGDYYANGVWSHDQPEAEQEPTTEEILDVLLGVTE